MKKTLFLIVLAFLPMLQIEIFSQNSPMMRQRDANSQPPKPTGSITGKVIDNDTKKPLIRATVTVHNATNNAQVTGGYTDKNGIFNLSVSNGNYYLQIKFVSYETQQKRNISITANNQNFDAGNIYLVPTAVKTKEVQVVAEREAIEVGLDRKVFNIEQDVQNLGGSAIDVLANIPSVTVDQDDNVSLRGNSNVRIMIDGRMSNLSASEALEQIPATMISSVELITNPGARYDAEGTAGIINVVTTRQRDDGVNAMINLNAGTDDALNAKLNGSLSANWNLGKWNIFANFSGRHGNRSFRERTFQTRLSKDEIPLSYLNESDTTQGGGRFFSGKVGADYNFSKNDVITYSLRVNQMKRIRNEDQNFEIWDANKEVINKYDRITDVRTNIPYGLNTENALSYKHNFEQRGHELFADFFYTTFTRNRPSTRYEQTDYLPSNFVDTATFSEELSTDDVSSKMITAQVDYAVPIGTNFKLEAGGKFSSRFGDVISRFDILDEKGEWITNPNRTNDSFYFSENVYAAYVTASSSIGKFKYNIGVRSETTNYKLDSYIPEIKPLTNNYTLFFPSVYLSYQINPSHQFNLSFSSRMRRPNYWDLNPTINYEDPLNLSSGNPDLIPESMYAGEGGYMLNIEKTTVTATLFYRYTYDGIERYRFKLNGDTTITKPMNISNSLRTGFELIAMQKITDWWKIDGNFTFYNTNMDASNLENGYSRNANNWSLRLNTQMSYNKILEAQLSGHYRSKMIRAQGEANANWNLDASFKCNLSRSLSLSLRVRDIFNTNQRSSWEHIPGILHTEHSWQMQSRSYFVGMTYKFHDFRNKRERRNDDEQRMNENSED